MRNLIFGFILLVFLGGATVFAQSRIGAPGDPGLGTATLRCTFWEREKTPPPPFFVKNGNNYQPLSAYVLTFGNAVKYRGDFPIIVYRKATDAEVAQRKAEGVKRSDLEYVPLFTINPCGLRDIGVILLPGTLENKPENQILVFDWGESSFPTGTIRIANFSRIPLLGKLTPRGNADEKFRLKHGEVYLSKPIPTERIVYDIQFATRIGKETVLLRSTNAVFRNNTKTMFFVIPKNRPKAGERPEIDFRMIRLLQTPEPPTPPVSSGAKNTRGTK